MQLSVACSLLCLVVCALGVPVGSEISGLAKRQSAQAAPHWAAYSDAWVSGENGPPAPSVIAGFNVFILGFLMTTGAADQALEWEDIGTSAQSTIKSEYSSAGIKLLVSAFGSTDAPTSSGYDPTTVATTMANWVKTNQLDGIDVDYEDFNAMNAQDGSAEDWLTTFTQVLRDNLPTGQYIITHAPVAPWFSGYLKYTSGAYQAVNSNVGSLIDWYNVQFYNQGTTEYTTCSGLLTESSSTWPQSALFQINSNAGVALNKLVIGKPANTADATNGYIAPATLATCVETAKNDGWSAGVMTWEYPDAESSWITTVRSDSWPV